VAIDTAISANHLAAVQSFYIAEAGLEKGKLEAAKRLATYDWSAFTPLLNGTNTTPLELAFGTDVPFGGGNYSVTVSNDPGDIAPTVDTNRTIPIRSTGAYGPSTSTVAATIRMLTIPRLPGAVSFVRDADITTGGGSYKISGYDHALSDPEGSQTGVSAPRPGVALCELSASGHTVSSVRNIVNKSNEVSGSTDVMASDELNAEYLDYYTTALRPMAENSVNCSEFNVVYVNADLTVACQAGKGILMVDGNLEFLENSAWQGVVIVKAGALKLDGSNHIRGGVVIGGSTDGVDKGQKASLDIGTKGGIDIFYSQEAINNVTAALTGREGKWSVLFWRRIR
jgi:hypothetical protein